MSGVETIFLGTQTLAYSNNRILAKVATLAQASAYFLNASRPNFGRKTAHAGIDSAWEV